MVLGLREAVVFVPVDLLCQVRHSLVTVATIPPNRKCLPGNQINQMPETVKFKLLLSPFFKKTVQEELFMIVYQL